MSELPGYVLYAIEEDGVDGPQLMPRYDENGQGSPMTWDSRVAAEHVIRMTFSETGCYDGMRVVELSVTARFPEPFFCLGCDQWGDIAEHIGHDTA